MLLEATNERRPHPSDEARILTERAHADHGVSRVVVHVEHRRESHMDSDGATFDSGDAALFIRQRRIPCRAERHLRRKNRRSAEINVVRQEIPAARPEAGAGLVVRADNQRCGAQPLHGVQLLRRLERRAH